MQLDHEFLADRRAVARLRRPGNLRVVTRRAGGAAGRAVAVRPGAMPAPAPSPPGASLVAGPAGRVGSRLYQRVLMLVSCTFRGRAPASGVVARAAPDPDAADHVRGGLPLPRRRHRGTCGGCGSGPAPAAELPRRPPGDRPPGCRCPSGPVPRLRAPAAPPRTIRPGARGLGRPRHAAALPRDRAPCRPAEPPAPVRNRERARDLASGRGPARPATAFPLAVDGRPCPSIRPAIESLAALPSNPPPVSLHAAEILHHLVGSKASTSAVISAEKVRRISRSSGRGCQFGIGPLRPCPTAGAAETVRLCS